MEQKEIAEIKAAVQSSFDEAMKEKLTGFIDERALAAAQGVVEKLRAQRMFHDGKDITLLSKSQKKGFVEAVRAAARGMQIDVKANEALVEQQDGRGGYLVSQEVADAILRIAASVGTILSQAAKWTMTTDKLAIPNYTGSFLTGGYLGIDVAGPVTGLVFGQAQLIVQQWQLAFVVGNDLLADASENLADWLMALAGEALANMIDQQGFIGTGAPFTGILNNANCGLYQMPSGETGFKSFLLMEDSSATIGQQEESVLNGSAFYFNRTVWASLRTQRDGAGNYVLPYSAWSSPVPSVEDLAGGGPIRPAGRILDYPVYTNRWLPTLAQTAVSTSFGVFGNMGATAFGDKGGMEVDQFTSGSFGGKEIALANQRGIVYRHRHAFTIALPAAFQVIKTAAS